MSVSRRITTRFTRSVLNRYLNSPVLFGRHERKDLHAFATAKDLVSSPRPNHKVIPGHVSLLHHSAPNSSAFQWFGFSSSASPESNEKETAKSSAEQESKADKEATASDVESDSEIEIDLSKEDLVKLVTEKEQLLEAKQEEFENMKDKLLRTYAEMENVKERTRRESENSKKFAIQNFAKSLLDVADNLNRASSAAKESYTKIDASKDSVGAVQQLKILLEGVEMTEKQLSEVFKKFGLEKYDPIGEEFDPNRHNAVFNVPDASKPPGHVGVVLKSGYMLHERVVRPAEVGVTVAPISDEADN